MTVSNRFWSRPRHRGALAVAATAAALVAATLSASYWVYLLGTVPGAISDRLSKDNALDVLSALAASEGGLSFHGTMSYNLDAYHPGPVLHHVMALGIKATGSEQAPLGAALAVIVFSGLLVSGALALVARRAGLAVAAVLLASFALLHGARLFPGEYSPGPGLVWPPAVAGVATFALAVSWGLIVQGRWALPLVALLSCVSVQVYLPTAPAAVVVMVTLVVVSVRLWRRNYQRPYIVVALVVLSAGLTFIPARLATEGFAGVASSLFGSSGDGLLAHPAEALELLLRTFTPLPWLAAVPFVGVPLGYVVARRVQPQTLLRPLGQVVCGSSVLAVLLGFTLVVSANRAELHASVAWPFQASVVVSAASLACLLFLGVLVGGASVLPKFRVRGRLEPRVGLAAQCVAAGVSGVVLVVAYFGVGLAPASPWFSNETPAPTSMFAAQMESAVLHGGSGTTLVALLTSPTELPDEIAEPVLAGILAADQAADVCWRGVLPVYSRFGDLGACALGSVTQVLTVVPPDWAYASALPGVELASTPLDSGPLVIRVSSPEEVLEWLDRQEFGPVEAQRAANAYCALGWCPIVDVPLDCSSARVVPLDVGGLPAEPTVLEGVVGSPVVLEVTADQDAVLSFSVVDRPGHELVRQLPVVSGEQMLCLTMPAAALEVSANGVSRVVLAGTPAKA